MKTYQITLELQSAFATALKGDTLFGQLCWALRNRHGEERLNELLSGYTQDQPFAVISDAFPAGYFPLPKLPSGLYRELENIDRKAVKKLTWLSENALINPLAEWLQHAKSSKELNALSEKHPQPHNTINRQSNTTGEDGFAPYSVEQEWFIPSMRWSIYLLLDERLSTEECEQCLSDIGQIGYGKDASIGMGKFKIEKFEPYNLPSQPNANACLTLAPCAPQGQGYDSSHCYYQLFTRFGRHGDQAVHQQGKPFKNPILMAQTAALFSTMPPASGFIGQGIGGNGELSKTLPATIHQGYAPIIGIHFNAKECL